MHGFWPFEIEIPSPQPKRTLVIFCSAPKANVESLADCVEFFCDKRTPPEHITLIAPVSENESVQTIVESERYKERIPAATRYQNAPSTNVLFFDSLGKIVGQNHNPTHIEHIKRMGLTYLVNDYPVFLTAPPSHHFVIPSGKHTQGFFRIGSAMVDGAAIDFMAFCCLPCFPLDVKHIYCDTGTISPVAFAINGLRQRIDVNSTDPCAMKVKLF